MNLPIYLTESEQHEFNMLWNIVYALSYTGRHSSPSYLVMLNDNAVGSLVNRINHLELKNKTIFLNNAQLDNISG